LKQRYEHLIKPPVQLKRSKKLYGIVELEIEVTELLENISTALCHLQKLDLLSATNYDLRIFQKDIATLTDAVINLKCKVQKTFKNITFQEDIQCLASSKEISREMNSREVIDKTGHSIREPKELDETQNEFRSFHHRLAAGSSIIASEKKHPLITEEIKKKVMPEEKTEKPRRIHADEFEDIIEDSGYNHSESRQSVNLSSYDFSDNSEISTFPFLWKGQNVKKRKGSEGLKPREIKNSENMKQIFNVKAFSVETMLD
uniref:LUZP1 protein n=1 Tax=Onchocerca flexuosa TaxID=387005 RepID=A0A183HIB2_9BILA